MNDQSAHIAWFRNASPYINLHRGRTFVICFGGEALLEANFASLVHDLALLRSLGIKLVLVHGVRPQIDARLRAHGIEPQFEGDLRVTDTRTLAFVKEAVGSVRVDLEASLSYGLPNTPMSGSRLRIASGNFVSAQPWGVRGGVDFQHTGGVRRIDAPSIHGQLELGQLVLLSPLGYSPTGEVFNLLAEAVAAEAAIALRAHKLFYLLEGRGLAGARRGALSTLTPPEVDALLASRRKLQHETRALLGQAVHACRHGVARTHLVSRRNPGALLQELFTRDGAGTMISAEPQEALRGAHIDDVSGVLELIEPLEKAGILVRRSREQLELEIENFCVIEKDGAVLACAALYAYPHERVAELACVAVHREYLNDGRGARLLRYLEQRARSAGLERLFALTTHTAHWFVEHGFEPGRLEDIPVSRRELYNYQRRSKVFVKPLG